MDVDLQDPPSLLSQMYNAIKNNNDYDNVIARRNSRIGEPIIRSIFANFFYKLINKISDTKITPGARDFCLMKRKVVKAIISMKEYNRFSKGLYSWVGFKTFWITYENVERSAGSTKWGFWKLVKYAFDGIFNFSQAPLRIASCLGIAMTAFAIMMMIYIILRKLFVGNPTVGWASTAVIIFFVGGIQLFCIGIMGQYIAKIFTETKQRPHFIIMESDNEEFIDIG